MNSDVVERLNQFIADHLPLMVNMGAEIEHYDGEKFLLKAPLALNHNDKNTGFGGSLYCICVLNAIGLVFLKCFEKGMNPDLVVGKAEIEYKKPVTSESIIGHCDSPSQEHWDAFFDKFAEKGKAGISLESRIFENDEEAVYFSGRFALIGETDSPR